MVEFPWPAKANIAIVAILILAVVAMWQGIDGVFYFTCVAVISGLGGYIVIDDMKEIVRLYWKPK